MKLRLLISLKQQEPHDISEKVYFESIRRDEEMILTEAQKEYSTLEEAKAAKNKYLGWAGEAGRLDDIEIIIATVDQGE